MNAGPQGVPGGRFTALVLAGQRRPDDPVARAAGVAYKCWAPAAGVPMLLRVVEALSASGAVGRIVLSIDAAALDQAPPAFAERRRAGGLEIQATAATPSASVKAAAEALDDPFPLLITTADHALLTPDLVDRFCAGAEATGADIVAGLTQARVITRSYPATRRTYLRFRDGRRSGANLFAVLDAAGMPAVDFWRRVEAERKRPWRMARAFGLRPLLAYLLGLLSLDGAMREASRVLGVRAGAVDLPFAEAAIDVDKAADLELAERILEQRGGGHVHPRPSV